MERNHVRARRAENPVAPPVGLLYPFTMGTSLTRTAVRSAWATAIGRAYSVSDGHAIVHVVPVKQGRLARFQRHAATTTAVESTLVAGVGVDALSDTLLGSASPAVAAVGTAFGVGSIALSHLPVGPHGAADSSGVRFLSAARRRFLERSSGAWEIRGVTANNSEAFVRALAETRNAAESVGQPILASTSKRWAFPDFESAGFVRLGENRAWEASVSRVIGGKSAKEAAGAVASRAERAIAVFVPLADVGADDQICAAQRARDIPGDAAPVELSDTSMTPEPECKDPEAEVSAAPVTPVQANGVSLL
jgi:hypothetical protein